MQDDGGALDQGASIGRRVGLTQRPLGGLIEGLPEWAGSFAYNSRILEPQQTLV